MRRSVAAAGGGFAVAVAAALTLPSFAGAEKPKKIDVSSIKSNLVVLHDGSGHYIAIEPRTKNKRTTMLFYGDGKNFYLQRSKSASFSSKKPITWNRRIWSPTSPHGATLFRKADRYSITCQNYDKPKIPLTELGGTETTKLLAKAKFYERAWARDIRYLARDEEANYYLVDSLSSKERRPIHEAPRDIRVYRGPAGKMKRLKVKNLAIDKSGMVIVAKSGTLLIDLKAREINMKWKPPSKKGSVNKIGLRVVSIVDNRNLIFTTLGVYPARLGTPCDDLYAN